MRLRWIQVRVQLVWSAWRTQLCWFSRSPAFGRRCSGGWYGGV